MAKIILLLIDKCFVDFRIISHSENMRKLQNMENELYDGPNRDARKIANDFKKVFGDINVSLKNYSDKHLAEI